ncbi:MAG TPA: acyl-CoA dehydrogenase family protein [candidate division Zixibacteria bacterium]|nr:acyl-CoA dehydrogenase family protein [candidate division Zixibacteria bacterium]
MDFELTENHIAVQEIARDVAEHVILPKIREYDRKQELNPDVLPAMAKANLLGFCIPEKYGGLGMDYISLGIACEELEHADTSARVILSVHLGLFSLPILVWANEEQKQKYLVPAAKGQKIATFGLTEPAAGSDAVGIQTTAVKKGDHYIMNGEKMWISLAAVADYFLVFAWSDLEKKKKRDHSGLSAFIVESKWPGVTTGTIQGKLGVRAGNTGYIAFQDVKVPKENLVYEEGQGFKIAMFCLDQGRYTVAGGSCGLIRACRDACVGYAKDRKTFGVPIGEHQLVKQMIANMEAGYEYSRYLYFKAGWLKNQGKRSTRETSLAKWISCREAEAHAANAVQVFGSYGFSDEYPVERFYRNSKGASIYEGTREIHTIVQADYALGIRKDKELERDLPKVEQ